MSTPIKIRQQFQVNFNFDLIFTQNLFDIQNKILVNLLSQSQLGKCRALIVIDKGVNESHPKLKITYCQQHSKFSHF